LYILCP